MFWVIQFREHTFFKGNAPPPMKNISRPFLFLVSQIYRTYIGGGAVIFLMSFNTLIIHNSFNIIIHLIIFKYTAL